MSDPSAASDNFVLTSDLACTLMKQRSCTLDEWLRMKKNHLLWVSGGNFQLIERGNGNERELL